MATEDRKEEEQNEKQEKQEKEERKESLDKKTSKIPKVKLKRNLIFIVGGILLAIMVYAFINASNESTTSQNVQATVQEEPRTERAKDPSFTGNTYANMEREKEENNLPNYGKVLKSENIVIEDDEILGKNLKLEEYYTGLVQEEISSRNSEIDYGATTKISNDNNEKESRNDENISLKTGYNTIRKEYNSSSLKSPLFKNELKAGSVIPSILLTGVNSDLPGDMIATVREDVYDTITGKKLLIPKGTRILGTYDSGITFGQKRILIIWQRLIFPNGKSIMLDNFPGVDLSGYAGITGKVDNHTLKLVQSVVLTSVLGGLSTLVDRDNNNKDKEILNEIAIAGGERVVDIGETLAEKILNIKPTIKVKPGTRFTIIVNADLNLEPYRN